MKQFAPNCSTIWVELLKWKAPKCFLAIYDKNIYKLRIFKPISFLNMRALETAWKAIGAAVASAGLTFTPAFGQERADNTANAEAIEQLICELSDESLNATVPSSDQTDMPKHVVRTIAARGSRTGVVLAVYGNDQSVINDANRAVYDAHQCGDDLPVSPLGIVRGSLHDPVGIDVYSAGVRAGTFTPEIIARAREENLDLHITLLLAIETAANNHAEYRSWITGESADASGEQTSEARVVRTAANQPAIDLDQ